MNKIHGQRNTRLYRVWGGMKKRCCKPSHPFYANYGGRGITVCEEWRNSFEAFYDWAMSNGYSDDLTLDRIDNNGNYCPENCRFVTQTEQIRNRSISRTATINGMTKSLMEWASENGLEYQTVYRRFIRGVTGTELIKGVRR